MELDPERDRAVLGLFAAFPMVYAIFLPAFYLPITLCCSG